jgi:hypothetical protein
MVNSRAGAVILTARSANLIFDLIIVPPKAPEECHSIEDKAVKEISVGLKSKNPLMGRVAVNMFCGTVVLAQKSPFPYSE